MSSVEHTVLRSITLRSFLIVCLLTSQNKLTICLYSGAPNEHDRTKRLTWPVDLGEIHVETSPSKMLLYTMWMVVVITGSAECSHAADAEAIDTRAQWQELVLESVSPWQPVNIWLSSLDTVNVQFNVEIYFNCVVKNVRKNSKENELKTELGPNTHMSSSLHWYYYYYYYDLCYNTKALQFTWGRICDLLLSPRGLSQTQSPEAWVLLLLVRSGNSLSSAGFTLSYIDGRLSSAISHWRYCCPRLTLIASFNSLLMVTIPPSRDHHAGKTGRCGPHWSVRRLMCTWICDWSSIYSRYRADMN